MQEEPDPFLPAPDTSFALTPEQRSETFVAFDPDVVEQILRWVRPERRDLFRRTFFVSPEYQLHSNWGIVFPSDRPGLVALIRRLADFDAEP